MLEIPLSFPVRQRAAASNDRARCALPSLPYLTSGSSRRTGPAQPAHSSVSSRSKWCLPQARRAPSTSNTHTALFRTEGKENEHLQVKKAKRRPNVALGALQTSLLRSPKGTSPCPHPAPHRSPLEPPSLRGELPSAQSPGTPRWQRPGEVKAIRCPPWAKQLPARREPRPGTGPAGPPGTRSLRQTSASGPACACASGSGTPPPCRPALAVPLCAQRMGRGKRGQRARQLRGPQPRLRLVTENPVVFSSL